MSMHGRFSVAYDGVNDLIETMDYVGQGSGQIVTEVIEGYGGDRIQDEIRKLMPVSGRRWKGKKAPAVNGASLKKYGGYATPAVTVSSTSAYSYLYFPDDGFNTVRHYGGQGFFYRGAENAADDIVEKCIGALMNHYE